jgi:3-oxoacyl-[acyl-carrier protein] reductase
VLNPFDMSERTILVTGASSGIGRETSLLLSKLNARVILVARNQSKIQETLDCMENSGHVAAPFDLSNYERIPQWLRGITDLHGQIDGLVHSAGVQITAPLNTIEASIVEDLWKINVSASLWLAKGFRQRKVNNSGGSLVFLSSAAALKGGAALSAYSASKGAIIALTRALAVELSRDKIRVNSIAPGLVKTEMYNSFAMQVPAEHLAKMESEYLLGFGEAIDPAMAAVFLLSSASRWITGTTLVVDGGLTAQ